MHACYPSRIRLRRRDCRCTPTLDQLVLIGPLKNYEQPDSGNTKNKFRLSGRWSPRRQAQAPNGGRWRRSEQPPWPACLHALAVRLLLRGQSALNQNRQQTDATGGSDCWAAPSLAVCGGARARCCPQQQRQALPEAFLQVGLPCSQQSQSCVAVRHRRIGRRRHTNRSRRTPVTSQPGCAGADTAPVGAHPKPNHVLAPRHIQPPKPSQEATSNEPQPAEPQPASGEAGPGQRVWLPSLPAKKV